MKGRRKHELKTQVIVNLLSVALENLTMRQEENFEKQR
jgi:hypothetical protein